MKNLLRKLFNFLGLDLTKNLEYDRLTKIIIDKVVNENSVCVDVGCHKGEILDLILNNSPAKKHYAFEPLPYYFERLNKKYGERCHVFPYALSNHEGNSEFQFVKNAPAFSGIRQRKYNVESPEIEVLNVELKKLDEIIPPDEKIDLIKIDVEGAEYQVLLGAKNILSKSKPVLIFECGIGATDYYDTNPADIFEYLTSLGYKINYLKNYLAGKKPLTKEEFIEVYKKNEEYYFIAYV